MLPKGTVSVFFLLEMDVTNQTNTTFQAPADLAMTQSGQGKVCRMDDLVGKDFKILAFRDLPLSHQLSIAQYMPLEEGAEGETPASLKALLPAYLIQHGDDEWGVLNIAAERLKQSVMADEDRATGSETWEEYAAAFCAGGDVPHYDTDDRWPVLLSEDNYETLLDGWHRMHSYMRSGYAEVPALFAPEKRHYDLIGAQKGNVQKFASGDWMHLFGPGNKETRCRIVIDLEQSKLIAAQLWTGLKFEGMHSDMLKHLSESVLDANSAHEDPEEHGLEVSNVMPDWAAPIVHTGNVEGRFSLSDLYAKWDALGDVPIDGDDCIEEVFLDFGVGTHREGIWQWFERQHPLFIVGDVMQGIRHQDDGEVQLLQSYGYFAGARDPKVKPEFSGRFMVRDTEDDADGFCIVGDDLGALVREALGCLEIASSTERGNVQNVSTIKIVVACRNASGSSDMPVFDVAATQDQIDLGEHYDLAEKMASEAGYEAPFVCFDPQEVPALKRALEAYGYHAEKAHDDVTPGM